MDYGERLAHALALASKDRKALAEAIEVTQAAIGMVINGTTKGLKPHNHAKAAQFLKVDSYWLATGEGEARPPLMEERAKLSLDAVKHAAEFDRLTDSEKRLWKALLITAREAVPDERLAHLSAAAKTKKREKT